MTISIKALEKTLKSRFQCKLFCDLASVSTTAGGLLQTLESCYQPQYDLDDRIVFYTSNQPSQEMLQHLYETANFLDISNWFVLICGPQAWQDCIDSACKMHSQDPVPFQFLAVEIESTEPISNNFVLPSTICSIPWNNIEIRSNGDITPCCMSSELVFGNVNNISLTDAFNSPAAKELRDSLRAGDKPSACQSCWKVEERNLTSIRMHNIKRTKKQFLLEYVDNPKIGTIDIKFNNTCNFKCRICSRQSSSAFAQEEHKFRGVPLVIHDNWGEDEKFMNQVIELLPDIHNIDMYGGEPFLIKKFERVLKLAVEQGYAKNIRLHYNSNGSVWPKNFLEHWPHFKQIDIHFSIDAIGAQFEFQRGGRWDDVEQNILQLKNLGLPNLSISIMPTISVMNIFYIDQVYDWAQQHGFQIFVSHMRGQGLEIKDLTKKAKEIILKKFATHPWPEMQNLLQIIKELPDSDGKEFYEKTKWFDQIRQESFAQTHPEIAKAMNYV